MANKPQILIADSAEGTNVFYERMLGKNFECTICTTGKAAKKVIEQGEGFDLALMELVLPVEDEKLRLEDAWTTGVRLIRMMLEKGTCQRFYVCTSQDRYQEQVISLCDGRAVLHFEHLFDNEPEEFLGKVTGLLDTPIPARS
jgi:CheY-like chemotaxis protein